MTSVDRTFTAHIVRDEGLAENRFRAIISTGNVDRYGTRFVPEGGNVESFLKNPVMFFKHMRWTLPIGRVVSLALQEGEWRAEFEIDDDTELEQVIIKKLNRGSLNAVSIGARINPKTAEEVDGVTVFNSWELYELSVVDIPGNADAVITARSMDDGLRNMLAQHRLDKGGTSDRIDGSILERLASIEDALEGIQARLAPLVAIEARLAPRVVSGEVNVVQSVVSEQPLQTRSVHRTDLDDMYDELTNRGD